MEAEEKKKEEINNNRVKLALKGDDCDFNLDFDSDAEYSDFPQMVENLPVYRSSTYPKRKLKRKGKRKIKKKIMLLT